MTNTEIFTIDKKELIFNVPSMHDCYFTVLYNDNILTLVFDDLNRYRDLSHSPIYGDYKKLTIKYYVSYVDLNLKYLKKKKLSFDTIEPLDNHILIMYKYSVDSFGEMRLHFNAEKNKKFATATIDILPTKIECIWE